MTLLPVLRRLLQLKPRVEAIRLQYLELKQEDFVCHHFKLIPYTILKPRWGGQWIEAAERWHHTDKKAIIVSFSKLPKAYYRFLEIQRKRKPGWLRKL